MDNALTRSSFVISRPLEASSERSRDSDDNYDDDEDSDENVDDARRKSEKSDKAPLVSHTSARSASHTSGMAPAVLLRASSAVISPR